MQRQNAFANMLVSQVVAMENFLSTQVQEGTSCMKLTNLSLAILVAVGVAACGGSDDNNSNKPIDPTPKPTPDNNNNNNNNNNNQADNNVVDPTNTQVVDNKDLTKVSTVGTLQYIRRDGSQYDRANNPSKQASASPLLGVTLNNQNPSLTNIVLARQEVVRADGQPVKAQFTGSSNPIPLDASNGAPNVDTRAVQGGHNGNSLQQENFKNVDVLAGLYTATTNTDAAHTANNINPTTGQFTRTLNTTGSTVYNSIVNIASDGKRVYQPTTTALAAESPTAADQTVNTSPEITGTAPNDVGRHAATELSAIIDRAHWQKSIAGSAPGTFALEETKNYKDKKGRDLYFYRGETKEKVDGAVKVTKKTVTATYANTSPNGTRYGKGLVWWSAPETAFENKFTRNETDASDTRIADENNAKAATNGLIRVGGGLSTLGEETKNNPSTGKWEDHHNTTTRIFGRYHLAYADTSKQTVNQVSLNSFSGAKTFVAEYDAENENRATQYSLGAQPITLTRVQYGRVSSNLDVDAGVTGYQDGFMHSDYVRKNREDGVDNYFYRGTDATSIEQMAALPSNQSAVYHGHALMYGINNDFHGNTGKNGRDLPNSFAPATSDTSAIGMGNFVEARVNFNNKRVTGEVYNTWLLDPTKNVTTKDKLVQFQGAITGNTVVGTADRAYASGDDNATFKASFFGDKAQEMGGSFNSVKDDDKYGDAYGANDWGGVFGATRGETNTFQGDDGNNVYSD
ncbi:transferrin-binding protein-like solute binding protein [uncultured Cardiobacterium sp.]|uniref:transferrin-binding protein-like solute binding protein n=1 Tax=uncultured Cardiobacterium sp. TaxID=417619 RepID=UPI002621EEE5|nr:transferrin-binding protein-like solute binding protein [uncultured Cardiobacterium sp.]